MSNNIKCGRCHDEGCEKWGLKCLKNTNVNCNETGSNLYKNIEFRYEEISVDNNYTYIGNRNDLSPNVPHSRFRPINGFVVESLKINEICISDNVHED